MEIVAWPWQFIKGKHNNMQSMCNEWCAHRQKDGLRYVTNKGKGRKWDTLEEEL
jgi:hypothetical protein